MSYSSVGAAAWRSVEGMLPVLAKKVGELVNQVADTTMKNIAELRRENERICHQKHIEKACVLQSHPELFRLRP